MLKSQNYIIYQKNYFNSKKNIFIRNNYSNFKIFLLKKERIYTKLKYSRVPLFDTVSGGFASLLAALLGFLITEKFGFELIDSGDFYLILMYLIFAILVLRVIVKLFEKSTEEFFFFFNIFIIIKYYFIIIKLIIKNFKK